MGGDPALVEALARGEPAAGVDLRSRRLLDFVLRLTRRPQDMQAADIDTLRGVGLTDVAIRDVAAVAAYFNFVNRVAMGLGIELEAAQDPPENRREHGTGEA